MMKDIQIILTDFYSDLDRIIEETWKAPAYEQYLEALLKGSQKLTSSAIEIGDNSQKKTSEKSLTPEGKLMHYIIQYVWIDQAKTFLILWRDVFFEANKAYLLFLENGVSKPDLERLKTESKETILHASNDLKAFFDKEVEGHKRPKNGIEKANAAWSLQQNPYNIYKEQLTKLASQNQSLDEQFKMLQKTSRSLFTIKSHIQDTIKTCLKELAETKSISAQATEYIETHAQERVGKIPPYFEDLEEHFETPFHLLAFSEQLNVLTDELEKKAIVPVETRGGLIHYKEINFKRNVNQWLESEVLPILYEVWELTERGNNGLKMSLLNIRNRALLLTNEIKEKGQADIDSKKLAQPINTFLNLTKSREKEITELNDLIEDRLAESFGIFAVFDLNRSFLPVPLQSTINQFKYRQGQWFDNVLGVWNRLGGTIQRFRTSVKMEEALSDSEKIVRYIQSRLPQKENHHYSSIFLTKGYIGESFWVGRKDELKHIEKLVGQWKLGYRGAVMLTGQRFVGKSLFGDLVANRYFPKNNICLKPNTNLKFQGRQFHTTYDLGESLEFIRKHSVSKEVCIWIDDLELWNDPNILLSQNVRKLCNFIDDYSGQIFFIVSLSNWLKNYLENTHEIGKRFQAEINLDRMSEDEVREAILIRHGATHKHLVGEDGNVISPNAFQKMTSKIHKSSFGNIGEALQAWSFSMKKIDEEKVIFESITDPGLPDFLNPDSAILLSSLMLRKRSNEYRMRKFFGLPFKEKYAGILQRLLNVGILTRHLDGWLEVNEVVVNEVGRHLERKGFINYTK